MPDLRQNHPTIAK